MRKCCSRRASSAIRSSLVGHGSRAQCLRHVSPNDSPVARPPSSPLAPRARFASFIGIFERLRLLVARSAALFPSLGGTSPAPSPVLPAAQGRSPWSEGPSLVRFFPRGDDEVSRFPGRPLCLHAPAPDPGVSRTSPFRSVRSAFCLRHGIGLLHDNLFSGLYPTAYGSLSTLRSSGRPDHHARLASGWWLALAG